MSYENIMERLKRIEDKLALALKMKNEGRRVGTVPFGWRSEDGKLEKDLAEQITLKRMRELRNLGESLREIARILNEQGLCCRNGEPWRHQYIANVLKRSKEHE
jgi:hypothetical protein